MKLSLLFTFALLVSVDVALAAKDKVILALNFQGIVGVTGQIVDKGARLALQALPSKVQNQYEVVTVNIGETLESVTTSLENEISKGMPIAIIGAVSSNQAFMINATSIKFKIPFITPLATHPEVTKTNPFAFRTCFDDNLQTAKLADFIHKDQKGLKGIVLYNEKQSYAVGVKNTFTESFVKFKDSTVEGVKFSTVDEVKGLVNKMESLKPDFIVLPSYQTEAANILSILGEKFKNVKFYGTDSWGGGRLFHTILNELPFKVEGYYVQHWSPDSPNIKNKAFLALTKNDEFLKKNDSTAMLAPAAVGFDAFNFLIQASENKKTKKITLDESLKTISHHGVTGLIQLNGSQTPSKALFIYKINNKGESFYVSYP